jgi:hypothetical protein
MKIKIVAENGKIKEVEIKGKVTQRDLELLERVKNASERRIERVEKRINEVAKIEWDYSKYITVTKGDFRKDYDNFIEKYPHMKEIITDEYKLSMVQDKKFLEVIASENINSFLKYSYKDIIDLINNSHLDSFSSYVSLFLRSSFKFDDVDYFEIDRNFRVKDLPNLEILVNFKDLYKLFKEKKREYSKYSNFDDEDSKEIETKSTPTNADEKEIETKKGLDLSYIETVAEVKNICIHLNIDYNQMLKDLGLKRLSKKRLDLAIDYIYKKENERINNFKSNENNDSEVINKIKSNIEKYKSDNNIFKDDEKTNIERIINKLNKISEYKILNQNTLFTFDGYKISCADDLKVLYKDREYLITDSKGEIFYSVEGIKNYIDKIINKINQLQGVKRNEIDFKILNYNEAISKDIENNLDVIKDIEISYQGTKYSIINTKGYLFENNTDLRHFIKDIIMDFINNKPIEDFQPHLKILEDN